MWRDPNAVQWHAHWGMPRAAPILSSAVPPPGPWPGQGMAWGWVTPTQPAVAPLSQTQSQTYGFLPPHPQMSGPQMGSAATTRVQAGWPVFRCEPCGKEFGQRSQYEAHCASHEACRVEGCEFRGSKRAVQAHFETAHGQYRGSGFKTIEVEGQAFRVLLGTDPEEVRQWREQRRRNWPSKANAERKRAKETERRAPDALHSLSACYASDDDADDQAGDEKSGADGAAAKRPRAKRARGTKGPRHCPAFLHAGRCGNPDCRLSHDVADVRPCTFFFRTRTCNRGTNCRFAHFRHEDATSQPGCASVPKPPRRAAGLSVGPGLLGKLLEADVRKETGLVLNIIRRVLDRRAPAPAPLVPPNADDREQEPAIGAQVEPAPRSDVLSSPGSS